MKNFKRCSIGRDGQIILKNSSEFSFHEIR